MLTFFFQAEDGIRDLYVTGVQTCALPISCSTSIVTSSTAAMSPKRFVTEYRPTATVRSGSFTGAPTGEGCTPGSYPRFPGSYSAQLCEQGIHRDRFGCGTRACLFVGDALHQRVHRCRYAVDAPEQHDLAVEIVGFDRARAAGEALPRRPAAPELAVDRLLLHQVAAPRLVLVGRREVDAGRAVTGLTLLADAHEELLHPGVGCHRRLDRVGEVHQELAVL